MGAPGQVNNLAPFKTDIPYNFSASNKDSELLILRAQTADTFRRHSFACGVVTTVQQQHMSDYSSDVFAPLIG